LKGFILLFSNAQCCNNFSVRESVFEE